MHTRTGALVTERTEIRPLSEAMQRDTEMEARANVPQMAVAYDPSVRNLSEFRVALIDQGRALMDLLESVEDTLKNGPRAA